MVRLSALAAIFLQVAATAALATQVLLFGGAAASNARPVDPDPIAVAVQDKAPVHVMRTLFDKPE
jgi:hypothetical protein